MVSSNDNETIEQAVERALSTTPKVVDLGWYRSLDRMDTPERMEFLVSAMVEHHSAAQLTELASEYKQHGTHVGLLHGKPQPRNFHETVFYGAALFLAAGRAGQTADEADILVDHLKRSALLTADDHPSIRQDGRGGITWWTLEDETEHRILKPGSKSAEYLYSRGPKVFPGLLVPVPAYVPLQSVVEFVQFAVGRIEIAELEGYRKGLIAGAERAKAEMRAALGVVMVSDAQ